MHEGKLRWEELVLWAKYDVERAIPSMVDGLKPGQRKARGNGVAAMTNPTKSSCKPNPRPHVPGPLRSLLEKAHKRGEGTSIQSLPADRIVGAMPRHAPKQSAALALSRLPSSRALWPRRVRALL